MSTQHQQAVAIPIPLPCMKKRFGELPRVPDRLRRQLRDKEGLREELVKEKRCLACRRLEKEHGTEALKLAKERGTLGARAAIIDEEDYAGEADNEERTG